jgi:HSP20 family protein
MAQFPFVPSASEPEIANDLRELFEELASALRHDQRAYSGDCEPPLDVFETDQAVEVVVDLPGVPAAAVRVLFRAGVLIVAGEKAPPQSGQSQAFHLVEREFGRFARAIRVSGAFDIANTQASLREGELTIVLPKVAERRGRAHRVRIA